MDWVPLVEMAHLVNSIRTRSALVSMMMVSSFTWQMVPTTPPMVVIDLTQEERLRAQVTALVRKQLSAPEGGLPPFSLASLQRMAQRAVERAGQLGVPVVFSAVDSGGNLVLLQRMEGALLGSVDVSAGKAYTANAFQMPTHELGQAARPDGPLYGIDASAPGKIVLFGGGFPYVVNGEVVGGIGVSGGTVEQDMDIAWYAMSL